MSSNDNTSSPSNASPPSGERRVIGGRATDDQIFLIDRAVLALRRNHSRKTRADFVVESAVERAKAVLAEVHEAA